MNKEIEEDDRGTKTSIKKCIKYHRRRKEIMKVKIISKKFDHDLEQAINIFLTEISDKKIINIQYSRTYQCGCTALIIYE